MVQKQEQASCSKREKKGDREGEIESAKKKKQNKSLEMNPK